jgi:DNA-binding SARP family transcriptional activator
MPRKLLAGKLRRKPPTGVWFAEASSKKMGVAYLLLSLFGPVTLRSNDREIRIKSLKLRAMIGYIALSDSLLETRERLVGLLWSESAEAQARAVLRQVTRELREIFSDAGSDGLHVSSYQIGFVREAINVDVWTVLDAAEAAEVHPLLLERPHLADDLLAGLEDLDPAFRAWVLAKRHTLNDRLLRALENALAKQSHDPGDEGRVAEAILNLDPTHEEACRRLMRAHASAGNTARALSSYRSLWDLLDKDYDMEPSPATQQLVAEIKMGAFEPDRPTQDLSTGLHVDSRAAAIPEPPQPMPVHAMPSTNPGVRLLLSFPPVDVREVGADKSHLVLGFRRLLIASLVRFREWGITDAPFPGQIDAQREAGARYEIQMYSNQFQGSVRLTIMLKELDSDFYIWTDGFELELTNWFDSQVRVVRRIAMALNVHLSAERLRRFSERPDVSLGVYDKWLRCQTLVRTFDPQHWKRLASQFAEIIAAAPGFVPAYCGLADLHTIEHIAHPGTHRARDREQKALELAREAVQLDPSDMNAHRCLAWAHAMAKQYGQAELHIHVACDLNPSDSWTAISAALLFAFCGKIEQASVLGHAALDLTLAPSRTHWAYQADIQFLVGDYAAAVDAADRAQDVLWGVAAWRTAALAHLGRSAEAAAEGQRFLSRTRANWVGAEPPTDEAIVRWLLHLHPLRRREDWERFRDGLRAAGLPTRRTEHYG